MVDIPARFVRVTKYSKEIETIIFRPDHAAEIIIYGVESEQVEEENDALNDMRCDLGTLEAVLCTYLSSYLSPGISKEVEEDQEELMPSCCCLNMMDCIFLNISSYCKNRTKPSVQL